jgi:hypothetical protein
MALRATLRYGAYGTGVPRFAPKGHASLTLWRVIKKNRDSYFNYAMPKKVWFIYLEMAVM